MEFKQVVGNRRSIRYYKPYQPVEKEKIQTILEAARLQCQHGNAGLVRKAVVVTKGETDDAIREELMDSPLQPAPGRAGTGAYRLGHRHVGVGEPQGEPPRSHRRQGAHLELRLERDVRGRDRAQDAGLQRARRRGQVCGVVIGHRDGTGDRLGAARRGRPRSRDAAAHRTAGPGWRELFGMPEHVTPAQIQIVGYPAEDPKGGGQRPRPPFEDLYFADTWGNSIQSDPMVVEELTQAGMFQEAAPVPWRAAEIRALAAMYGLPE